MIPNHDSMKHALKDPNNSIVLTPELMHYGKEVDQDGKFVTWVKKPRLMTMCCTCLWADGKTGDAYFSCHRFAPRPTVTEETAPDQPRALWPMVVHDDYCGDWQEK